LFELFVIESLTIHFHNKSIYDTSDVDCRLHRTSSLCTYKKLLKRVEIDEICGK